MYRSILRWLDARFGAGSVEEFLHHKTVPLHRYTVWYVLGGMTLFLFCIQVATGILLLMYYQPTADHAFESVQFIMTRVQFGWLIRSIHSWSANLMIFVVFVHMFSVYFLKAYRRPRELTWVSGMLLLFLILAFGFSGYLLPWNTLAFFATKVGTDMAGFIPGIGPWLLEFLRGGKEVTGATLTRFFGFHVAVLPGLVTLLLAVHLLLVQHLGMSVPPTVEDQLNKSGKPVRQMPFFPNFLLRDIMGWYAALGILGALAAIFPWDLGTKANPFGSAPAGIHPEWYFLFAYQSLKYLPPKIWFLDSEQLGLIAFGVAGAVWLMVPFLDYKAGSGRVTRFFTGLGVFVVAYMIVMSALAVRRGAPAEMGFTMRISIVGGAVLLLALAPTEAMCASVSCVTCHSQLEGELAAPASLFANDVHAKAGLTCADCHGGAINDDSMSAMSPANGFRGVPSRTQIPDFCGRCHSNPDYMRHYNPSLQTDQLSQYWTSVHGQRLRKNDTKVATCVDCHSVHNIRAVSDTLSTVYPSNIASTCAHCHANAGYMKGYGIPTGQYANYTKSVHAQDLASGDISAPTCSTCHGNHGAVPPGVGSVVNVCGTCHATNEQDFKTSPHQAAFASMGLPGCVTCHSNHFIEKPLDSWVGVGSQSVCVKCHSAGDKGYQAAQQIGQALATLDIEQMRAGDILANAESSGMEVSDAKVVLTSANDDIIKARVAIHTFDVAEVRKLTNAGMALARNAYQAGAAALHERSVRRQGLAISLIFVLLAIGGLFMKIRQIERRH